jgi:phosphoglycerate dehydrogenase-like enzyme
MAGRTFGLVGLGRIGKAVVSKVQGLGMKVIAYDPFADRDYANRHHVQLVSLPELFQQADVVSLHAPSTNDTNAMINAESLAMMKRGAILINTSRGALVDEAALAKCLQAGHLLGAALDVFRHEPLTLDSPLLKCENALLCTHMGGLDCESTDAASSLAAQCIVDLFHNHWPEGCVVNRELRDGWKW